MPIHLVDVNTIDATNYKVKPSNWIIALYIVVFLTIDVALFFLTENKLIKWGGIAICSAILIKISMQFNADTYLTLAADRKGLYFQTSMPGQYSFVDWVHVGVIEKTIFPLSSRGLRIQIGSECFVDANKIIGEVRNEDGRCFIYTIPQLRDRDEVIAKLYSMRPS